MGNDFFAECGDVFSCHVVDNPDRASELELLRSYAPSVEAHVLEKLVSAFSDLRQAVDAGKLAYPYSTRELVNLARHLHVFPSDGPAATVENVLAFDQHNTLAMATLRSILHRHGIPVSAAADGVAPAPAVRLSREVALPPAEVVATWHVDGSSVKTPMTSHALAMNAYEVSSDDNIPAECAVMHRLSSFSECLSSWVISERHGRGESSCDHLSASAFCVCCHERAPQ